MTERGAESVPDLTSIETWKRFANAPCVKRSYLWGATCGALVMTHKLRLYSKFLCHKFASFSFCYWLVFTNYIIPPLHLSLQIVGTDSLSCASFLIRYAEGPSNVGHAVNFAIGTFLLTSSISFHFCHSEINAKRQEMKRQQEKLGLK